MDMSLPFLDLLDEAAVADQLAALRHHPDRVGNERC